WTLTGRVGPVAVPRRARDAVRPGQIRLRRRRVERLHRQRSSRVPCFRVIWIEIALPCCAPFVMKCILGCDLVRLGIDIWLASLWIDWRLARFGIDQRLIRVKYLHDLERIDVNVKRVRNWRRVRGVHYHPFLYFVEQHDRPNFTIEFLAVNRLLRGVWRSA